MGSDSPAAPSYERLCVATAAGAAAVREVLAGADLSAAVPTCPGWTLADLRDHIAGNLLTVEAAVRTGEPVDETISSDDLVGAAETLAATLRAAGPDGAATVWGFGQSTRGWARRAAYDILIHHVDAALTVGSSYEIDPEPAADALDEILDLAGGPWEPTGTSVHLHATDTPAEWLIDNAADGFGWRHGHVKATVAARGPLADLLLVVYRRLPPDRVEVLGDPAVLNAWLARMAL